MPASRSFFGRIVVQRKRAFITLFALLTGIIALSAVGVTAALWSDSAYVTAQVSVGNWAVGNTCEVRKFGTNALVPGRTCSITFDRVQSWTTRNGNARWVANAPGISNDEYIAFSVTVPTASMYAGWDWPNVAAVLGQGTLSSSCDAYPQFTGRLDPNLGATPQVYLTFNPSSPACA